MKASVSHFLSTSEAEKTAEWAVHACHSRSPFVTFLIQKPTCSRHFQPFPYVCNRKLTPPTHTHPTPKTEQDIYSTVGSQLSLQDNLEHSPVIVFPLFLTVSDGRGRRRVDFRVKDTCLPHTHAYALLSVSVCVWLCSSLAVWAEMGRADRGQHFLLLPVAGWSCEAVGCVDVALPPF